MITLAKRTQHPVDPIDHIFSQVVAMNYERKLKGETTIINLCVGEPHIPVNKQVVRQLIEYLEMADHTTLFNYSQIEGNPDVIDSIAKLYKNYYPNVDYSHDEIMVCNGATQGLWNAFSILLNPNDTVLLFEPYYSVYAAQIRLLGAKAVKVPTQENNFRPNPKSLSAILNLYPDVKAIVFNYPNNPTGIDLTQTELVELCQILQAHPQVAIIVDDVYRELTIKEHYTVLDVFPELKNRCIMINSASKGLLGAPGVRIGMIGASAPWINQMKVIQALSVTSVSVLAQQILSLSIKEKLNATKEYTSWLLHCKNDYAANCSYMTESLEQIGFKVVAGGHGFFLFVDASFLRRKCGLNTDMHIIEFLLHVGIALIPGSAFGLSPDACFIRLSCAKPKTELENAIRQIETAIRTTIREIA